MPTQLIQSWPAETLLFDGELMAGPVATLFSQDPDEAAKGIKLDPLKAHWDLMKISRRLIMAEHTSGEEAAAILKKPREGTAVIPFKGPRLTAAALPDQPQEPAAKKARTQPESGRQILYDNRISLANPPPPSLI